jgi:hypothetical protein
MSTRTEAEIFAATLADYAVTGRAAIERLRERSASEYVRLAVYLTNLPDDDLEKLCHACEVSLHTMH